MFGKKTPEQKAREKAIKNAPTMQQVNDAKSKEARRQRRTGMGKGW